MMKNAINEMTRYKRLPVLTNWAWKCIITGAVIGVAFITAG